MCGGGTALPTPPGPSLTLGMTAVTKAYDRSYFDRWYRGRARVTSFAELRRKVTMVLSACEYFLRHPVRNVLDVGCGEAPWFVHVKALRPRVSYVGIDPSEYAVAAFGSRRNIRRGSFADLPSLGLTAPFDLVVCSDVMHYLTDAEIRRGLPTLVELTRGMAFLEVFTKEDRLRGDFEGMVRRPARWYRNAFRRAGLSSAGPYLWLSPALRDGATALETS
jgi:SAM-dependent methyltransferase